MSKYLNLEIREINKLLREKIITPKDLVEEAFKNIEDNAILNSFITLNKEEALKRAIELENKEVDTLFFGIPIAIKDNICTENLRTTCASKMLENFVPIYDATVVKKIKENNMIIIGKTNMDEFAMGSTSKTSYFKEPKNPWNIKKITGGSSGGSASCVGAGIVPLSLGSDTGGSIRQPASYCGLVGIKPTYGRVSRYGLVAFASSLDQIGHFSKNVYDNAAFLNVIAGLDENDMTSSDNLDDFTRLIGEDIKGMKIAIPSYFVTDIVDKNVLDKFNDIVSLLREKGCLIDFVEIEHLKEIVTLYQIIAMGEASSNLARFDGIKYGYSHNNPSDLEELYAKTRGEGFGDEVKRRIMIGSLVLSGDNARKYYDKALKIRDDIRKNFLNIFKDYDLIIGPTTTTTAYDIDSEQKDPNKSFLDDVLVMPANMAGIPALNLPIGFIENLPIGMQIIGKDFDEATIYKLASFIEKELKLDLNPKGGASNE